MVTAAALPLSGCLLPPAISLASLLLDVGSFAVSGKTMTDHGLSLVAQEDCALSHVLSGQDVCAPEIDYATDISLAALQPLDPSAADWASLETPADGGTGVLASLGYAESQTALAPSRAKLPFFKTQQAPGAPLLQPQLAALDADEGLASQGTERLRLGGYLSDPAAAVY